MELIKNTVKVGNSAGVLLPREWLGTKVKVVLEPLDIEKDVLDILIHENLLNEVIGIYLVGSYARDEQEPDSDIDILVITESINKKIEKARYDIMLISKEELKKQLESNALPLLPMLKESKVIINKELKEKYSNTEITKRNINWHIKTTKSAMKVIEKSIELSKEMDMEEGDGSAYSLILRLRTLYIIDCLRKNKLWNKKELLKLIKKISGSLIAYEGYLRVKNNPEQKIEYKLKIEEAEKLMDYVIKKTKEIENWLKERND